MSDTRTAPQGNGQSLAVMPQDNRLLASAMEHVLGTGDLGELSTEQRVAYYHKVCEFLGLNPLTRPFRFLKFQGSVVMYATRDACDQLRKLNNISLTVVDRQFDENVFMVTVRATAGARQDEDMGAVPLPKTMVGEARANAIMKCITKAKRRVTLSICGLGFNSEDEVETLSGISFDHDAEAVPQAPSKQETKPPASKPSAPKQAPMAYEWPSLQEPDSTKWLANFLRVADECASIEEVTELSKEKTVSKALAMAPPRVQRDINDKLTDTWARLEKAKTDEKAGPAWDDGSDAAEPGSIDEVLPPELRAKPETPAE